MVIGLDKFREHFENFTDNYIIIGGTACDVILDEAGLTPRATKDIDIILVVEALKTEFVKHFWSFIEDGKYEVKEKSAYDRKYYRFLKPADTKFPKQLELFSRVPDLLDLKEESHLTPIPIDGDTPSLSAILLDDDYYNYTIKHSKIEDNVNIANIEALICLKVKAFLDLTKQKAQGKEVDSKNIRKHKTDVFRMASMLTSEDIFELTESVKGDMQQFAELVKDDLPDKRVFKDLGLPQMDVDALFKQFLSNFKLG